MLQERGQFSGFDYRLGRELGLLTKKSCQILQPAQISIRSEKGAFRPGCVGLGKRPVGETDAYIHGRGISGAICVVLIILHRFYSDNLVFN